MSKQTVRVTVVDQRQWEESPFYFGASYEEGSLDRVIESLEEIRESIPEQYRAKARCEIESDGGYEGNHCATIMVTYDRPESADETSTRLRNEEAQRGLIESQERLQLRQLQEKYGA